MRLAKTLLSLALLTPLTVAQTPLTTVRVASGLSSPLYVCAPEGDWDRLFIVEQNSSLIKILDLTTNQVMPTPFLDLSAKTSIGGERGLLGLAFHPDYENNGFFFVNYTDNGGDTVVERYTVSTADPNVADPASVSPVIGPINQPFSNHNGGCIQFGPDGYLYIGLGDGGSFHDPGCRAQKGDTLLGKMLRLDVDTVPYAVPSDNPFLSDPLILDEIWSFGLRNPWRYSFDRLTGDLYIGDVGQDLREEVDFEAFGSPGGLNYGWKVMEGFRCNSSSACPVGTLACNDPGLTTPIKQYNHTAGCSITGGYVYRGCAIPDLQGTYFYSDYCQATLWTFEYDGSSRSNDMDRTAELDPPGSQSIDFVVSFGEDARGELYIVDQGGEIFKIVPNVPSPFKNLGFGKVGSNGLEPELSGCGLLDNGLSAEITLRHAAPSSVAAFIVSLSNNPTPGFGGTLVPIPPLSMVIVPTGPEGMITATAPGGPGPLNVYLQVLVSDPGATNNTAISNALQLIFP